jgi:23S rRNA pseudouridine2605 synthase
MSKQRPVKSEPAAQRPLKTLERVLSKAGLCSRTEAQQMIAGGRVKVNGRVIRSIEYWVDMELDQVSVDNRPVTAAKRVYLLLYKPTGYVTTRSDRQARPTVYDLLSDVKERLFYVGRLDRDTSGLLIMTNDSQFAERLANPQFKVPKTYLVKTTPRLSDDQLHLLRDGIDLADGLTRPAAVTRLRDSGNHTFFEITITEGRNRQVRRMVEALGATTLKLVRTRIGSISIGALQIGRHRLLEPDEIRDLQKNTVEPAGTP